ncbi:MAG: hypothetical protein R3Y46_05230 [Opitutales bacterium]
MAKKRGEISVFSMSAIDLFCSALGAFMIIAIIVMPSYSKKAPPQELTQEQAEEIQENIQELQKQIENLEVKNIKSQMQVDKKKLENAQITAQVDELDSQVEAVAKALNGTFLIVVASWETKGFLENSDDIDMYVVDPKKNKYNYINKRYPNIDAELAEDAKNAIGIEVWETSSAMAGTYEVYFIAFQKRISQDTTVKLRIYTKDGKLDLEDAIVGDRRYSNTYYITMDEFGKASVEVKNIQMQLRSAAPKS